MKIRNIMLCWLVMSVNTVGATEYVYRDLMGNSLTAVRCEAGEVAKATAIKEYTLARTSKKFCQSQGYGWHLEKIQDVGKTICENCSENNALNRCHQEDMLVTCKRIKPGSVGMLPGKG